MTLHCSGQHHHHLDTKHGGDEEESRRPESSPSVSTLSSQSDSAHFLHPRPRHSFCEKVAAPEWNSSTGISGPACPYSPVRPIPGSIVVARTRRELDGGGAEAEDQ
jgi:hypothetical protein